jgi:hypothetical protein
LADYDEIDPSEDLISPERLAKGDLEVATNMRGKINRAIPANLTIIKELVRRGVWAYHMEIYGVGYIELRNCFRAPWTARSCAVLLEQWGQGVSRGIAGEIYQNVNRKLGKNAIGWIEYVVEEPKEKEDPRFHGVWEECFNRLIAAMDEEKKRIEEENS